MKDVHSPVYTVRQSVLTIGPARTQSIKGMALTPDLTP